MSDSHENQFETKGLYYVGGDAGGFGLGTHQAVDSAVNVSHLVLDYYHRTRQANSSLFAP